MVKVNETLVVNVWKRHVYQRLHFVDIQTMFQTCFCVVGNISTECLVFIWAYTALSSQHVRMSAKVFLAYIPYLLQIIVQEQDLD